MINPAQDASDRAFSYWWRLCPSVLDPSDPGSILICGTNGGLISSSLEEEFFKCNALPENFHDWKLVQQEPFHLHAQGQWQQEQEQCSRWRWNHGSFSNTGSNTKKNSSTSSRNPGIRMVWKHWVCLKNSTTSSRGNCGRWNRGNRAVWEK